VWPQHFGFTVLVESNPLKSQMSYASYVFLKTKMVDLNRTSLI
jgi:hypothetical protein